MLWHLITFLSSVAHASTGYHFMPPQGSTIAAGVDTLYGFLAVISAVSSVIVILGMIYFGVKYRRKGQTSAYISHNTTAEFLWSFIPFLLFMVAFGWGWYVYSTQRTMPENAFEVEVVAQQWKWQFRYKSGKKSADLVVPVHTPIKLIMRSNDVIHSFYVPAFRQKQDVVPGRYTATWFEATAEGEYHLFCAEYCGDQHSGMLAVVQVLSQAEFEKWLETDPYKGLTPAQTGEKLFSTVGCVACHNPNAEGHVEGKAGPGLAHVFGSMVELEQGGPVLADENYIRESILYPAAKIVKGFENKMIPFLGQLDEEELTDLIEYVKSLK